MQLLSTTTTAAAVAIYLLPIVKFIYRSATLQEPKIKCGQCHEDVVLVNHVFSVRILRTLLNGQWSTKYPLTTVILSLIKFLLALDSVINYVSTAISHRLFSPNQLPAISGCDNISTVQIVLEGAEASTVSVPVSAPSTVLSPAITGTYQVQIRLVNNGGKLSETRPLPVTVKGMERL